MRLTNFCNRFSTRAPAEPLILEVSDALARCASRATEPRPQRTTRVRAHLTYAQSFGRPGCDVPHLSMWASSVARSWWVPPIEGPSCDAPPSRRFQPRTRSASRPLTSPVAEPIRSRNPFWTQPEPLPPPPRQRTTAFPAQDAFHRRVLARRRFHGTSGASPPPVPRILPSGSGFRRFFVSRKGEARHRRFRGLIARERSAPRAARRLLQSTWSASTTDGPTKPQGFGGFPGLRPGAPPGPTAPLRGCGTEESWVRDRRVFRQCLAGSPSPRLLAFEGFAPTQSARTPLVACSRPSWLEWPRHLSSPPSRALSRVATQLKLSPLPGKDRLPHPSAKKSAFRRIRGAFHLRTSSLEEGPFVPSLSPVCGLRALRLFNPRLFRCPDESTRTAKTRS
jgi:hypothetical protein